MKNQTVQFKKLDSSCQVNIRATSPTGNAIQKQRQATMGLLVTSEETYSQGTCVEVDAVFPNDRFMYRFTGTVSQSRSTSSDEQPYEIGITVFGIDKIKLDAEKKSSPSKDNRPASASATEADGEPHSASPLPDKPSNEGDKQEGLEVPSSPEVTQEKTAAIDEKQEATQIVCKNLPEPNEVAELFTGLLGEPVTTVPADATIRIEDIFVACDYITDNDEVDVVAVMNLEFASRMGSAIAMIPSPTAEAKIREQQLNDETKENIQEVFNICASLFNKEDTAHHKFRRIYLSQEEDLPPDIQAIIDNPIGRLDLDVDIPGYGTGKVSYLSIK
ncbi:MAG: hypothetical protein QNJ97_09305 [Myxococcota bacterium]|nr:hypothetical protein [Myxococcota bacterium]